MQLKDYIIVINNAASNKLCDDIINEYKDSTDWNTATIWDKATDENVTIIDNSIRNCETISMSLHNVITKNEETRKNLDARLFVCVGKCICEYNKIIPWCKIEKDSGYQLLRYKEGSFYQPHVDSVTSEPRSVSCSIVLNDSFKGGEFVFFEGQEVYNLKKGDALLFPSNFLYPHEVKPVKSGTRYSIVTWFQ